MDKRKRRSNFIKVFALSILLCLLSLYCFACGNGDKELAEDGKEPIVSTPEFFTVTYSTTEGGSILGETEQTVIIGGSCNSVSAIADEGYEFVKWSDGKQSSIRQDSNISESVNITAYFAKKKFNILYDSTVGGEILGEGVQSVIIGNCTSKVEAVAFAGYIFVGWSDGYEAPIRIDTAISDCTYVAIFKKIYNKGDGGIQNPYVIENYEEFINMRYFPSSCFMLNCDLDLSGVKHVPLFTYDNPFSGDFNGNRHFIRNMTIDEYSYCLSLFGIVNGNIRNLYITNFSIIVPNYDTSDIALSVGALAGVSTGIIENVAVQGSIKGQDLEYDGVTIGGLVGQAYGLVYNCNVEVNISVKNVSRNGDIYFPFNIGGLIGISFADSYFCIAKGVIELQQVHNDVRVGGLISCQMMCSVRNCSTDVSIYGDSSFYCGGLIAELINMKDVMTIEKCEATGTIIMNSQGFVGGLICNIKGYTSEIVLKQNSASFQNIDACMVGGLLYSAIMDKGSLYGEMNFSNNNIHAYMAAGFGFVFGNGIYLYRCHSESQIDAFAAHGFIWQTKGDIMDECSATGILNADFFSGGFIMFMDGGKTTNCYSTCNINVMNADSNSSYRNLVGGFIVLAKNAEIENCFFAGEIRGNVYTPKNPPSYSPPIVSDFIGTVTNTQIRNCFVLHTPESFAKGIIGDISDIEPYDIQIFYSKEEMNMLTEKLNFCSKKDIWICDKNGLPILNYLKNNKKIY